jgi:hypothetical protein
MIRKVEMERFTLISSKPFDQVLAAINDAIGHPDMAEFWRSTHRARSVAELESTTEKAVGKVGLMLFSEFDHDGRPKFRDNQRCNNGQSSNGGRDKPGGHHKLFR